MRYRKTPPPADGVRKWKAALAAHGRQQRNRRGRRPQPPVVGVRIPAPKRDTP